MKSNLDDPLIEKKQRRLYPGLPANGLPGGHLLPARLTHLAADRPAGPAGTVPSRRLGRFPAGQLIAGGLGQAGTFRLAPLPAASHALPAQYERCSQCSVVWGIYQVNLTLSP